MNILLKKTIVVAGIAFLGAIGYYGSILPLQKSQTFIVSLRRLDSVQSVAEFKALMSPVFDIPSPIGQEELVRNTANSILGTIQRTENPDVISQLMQYVEGYYKPIMDRGTGMSFGQNLYILGTLNEFAFLRTKNPTYLAAAKSYYSKGLELGPKRPQFLYGMFDVYRMEGDVEGVRRIAAEVLSYWPDDARVKGGLEEYLKKVESSAAKKP